MRLGRAPRPYLLLVIPARMTAEHSAQIETERAGLAAMFLMMATARMFDLKSAA